MKLEKMIRLARMDPEVVSREIEDFIIERTLKFNYNGGIIGLSGGVDSTLATILTKRAYDRHNLENPDNQFELVGYILPTKVNSPEDTSDGIAIADKLGIRYEVHDLQDHLKPYEKTTPKAVEDSYHRANLISRIRGNVLNTKSAEEHKILIGTGNKDEDYCVGYYTLFGDGAVHLSPIGNLSKRLVRQLVEYHGYEKEANREPSAGLEENQTDFSDLGYRYNVVELVVEGKDQGLTTEKIIQEKAVASLVGQQITEYEQTFGSKKFSTVREVVLDVFKQHAIADDKAEIVHPPAAPITLRYD